MVKEAFQTKWKAMRDELTARANELENQTLNSTYPINDGRVHSSDKNSQYLEELNRERGERIYLERVVKRFAEENDRLKKEIEELKRQLRGLAMYQAEVEK